MDWTSVLFLCQNNRARSIMAEAYLNHVSDGAIRAFSAGLDPSGVVHPLTLDLLRQQGVATDGLESKSWEVFAMPGAPKVDVIVRVCEDGLIPTVWADDQIFMTWPISDPMVQGDGDANLRKAYARAFAEIRKHIDNALAHRTFFSKTRAEFLKAS